MPEKMESVERLLLRAQEGDEFAFAALTRRHYAMVRGIALSRTGDWSAAEEIAQDVFVQVWRNIRAIHHGRAFSLWVRAIARNSAVSWLRRKNAARNGSGLDAESLAERTALAADEHDAPDAVAARIECAEILRTQAASLSPKLREAMALYYFEGCSVAESARALGLSEDTFKKRLRLAREKMREAYERQYAEFNLEQCLPYTPRRCIEGILTGIAVAPVSGIHVPAIYPGALSLAWNHLWHGGSLPALIKAGLFSRVVVATVLVALLPVSTGLGIAGQALYCQQCQVSENEAYQSEELIGSEGTYVRLICGDPNYGDYLLVRGMLSDSPAEKAGLHIGDRIVRIAGKPVHARWHDDLEMRFRGPVGTVLKLGIERPKADGSVYTFDAQVIREYIPLRNYRKMWRVQGK